MTDSGMLLIPQKERLAMAPVQTARRRSLVLGLAVTAVAVSLVVALARPAAGLAAPSARTCATSNLRLDKIGESDFTSHRGWIFALRNVGSRTCRLKGYPGVRLLNRSAGQMPTTVGHFGGPARAVVLAPWHRAYFATTYAVSGPCSAAVFAYGMRITPPPTSGRLVWYAGRFDLCGPAPANVQVSPVAATQRF
jgi:uncharacterized protein DUF4232